ncbi:hypothetical protein K490DRAFT_56483 [Saccharata proteae CBS 121410]|uniref:Uncharacterized protein n=1 Tax=Saccharata proteae CBS 121410 TaxID=1314787 RepID=A0A9P4HTT9_9PEZI|nr:hypothetical protein K490DRAFT_56483 [Saccharata proteae CBS 121410]
MALKFDIRFTGDTDNCLSSIFTFHASTSVFPIIIQKSYHTNSPLRRRKRKRTNHSSITTSGPITKKRRLRHHLITSRLSHPYAVPTTHIANRSTSSNSKVALWTRYKHVSLGRALLRKAAILNCVQHSVAKTIGSTPNMAAARCGEIEMLRKKGVRMALLAEARGSLEAVNSTRPIGARGQNWVPSTDMLATSSDLEGVEVTRVLPSPLGLSNYDALDAEEDGLSGEFVEQDDRRDNDQDGLDLGMGVSPEKLFVSEYDRLDDQDG